MQILAVLFSFGAAQATTWDDEVVFGLTFMAGSTDPTVGSTGWALTSHGISEKLFTVDQDGEIVGQVAESVAKVSELAWDVTLKEDYFFSDGTAVTAAHVADCLNELNGANPSAQATLGAMTATAQSDGKVRIESERATHVMDSVLAEWVFTIYLRDGSDFLFTGPYAVETFDATGETIDLVPNAYYYDARHDERHPIKVKKYASADELADAAEALEVDIGFHLPADADALAALRSADGVHVRSFEIGYHYMMFHNIGSNSGRPIDDLAVRQAIDVALDRDALSQALAGGHGTRSLFPDYTPYYQEDLGDSHGDESAAEALLDAAGWTLDAGTGTRAKEGTLLEVDVVAYAFRPDLGTMQPSICDALSAVGITCNEIMTTDGSRSESDDWAEVTARLDEGDWDLLLWAQNTLPAGDPAWFLNAFFRSDGGSNHAGLQSTTVDDLLDAMSSAEDHSARVAATADAHAAILEEQSVSNLVTPEWHVSLSDRMLGDSDDGWNGYEPWGSDYYVIRADLFLTELAPVPAPTVEMDSAPTVEVDSATTTRALRMLVAGASLLAALLL